ncbi:flavin reductase [Enterobacter cloacae complex sp. ECC445]|uniref:flavin reductase n=1 Tax=Enterobacter cloacae complex sp. ECC445 TaxID=2913213 RepID=UPI001F3312C8|nr:flavin reductase [Enterobacter cloacae complex sp. ECC445]MCG0456555.1 flavin reductase [Enterobacter cloacae complex sp. ECC445]
MKLYGISAADIKTDALFYIQASSRQQAQYVFSQVLHTAELRRCKLMGQTSTRVIPSISRATLSLQPWAQNPLVSSRQLTMNTHGLSLNGTVSAVQMAHIVAFCDDLNLPLSESASDPAWATHVNAQCARLNPPRLYPVQLDADSASPFQIYVVAPAGDEAAVVIDTVMQEYFPARDYILTGDKLLLNKPPLITLESYRSDIGESILELGFASQGLMLTTTVCKEQLRQVLMLCEDFGVQLQGRAGASCHPGIRNELRRLAVVGVYSRPGAADDRRAYTSDEEKDLIYGLLKKGQESTDLPPARHGVTFNGVIYNATPSGGTTGFLYLSPDFPEGQFMMTAEVVNAGLTNNGVRYIETIDGFRFILTAYARQNMDSLLSDLAANKEYFSLYRWA